jgi:hypothetical protein
MLPSEFVSDAYGHGTEADDSDFFRDIRKHWFHNIVYDSRQHGLRGIELVFGCRHQISPSDLDWAINAAYSISSCVSANPA